MGQIRGKLFVIAQAGAQVMYNDLHASLDRSLKNGGYYTTTGNLKRAIYQKRRDELSSATGGNGAYYAVSYAGWQGTTPSGKGASQHAHLIEFGHTMRYQLVRAKNGNWVTARKKTAFGKTPPKRRASEAEKDAFYVLRKKGPLEVKAQPWFTPVLREGSPSQKRAQQAIEDKFKELFA